MTQTAAMPTHPRDVRELARRGKFDGITSGLSPGYVQANLAILPQELAFDFLLFCQRNPKPCPVIEVIEAGQTEPAQTAPGADIRTDLPKYRVYRHGVLEAEVQDIRPYWHGDLVSFLIGCSYSFENAMLDAGIPLRHHEQDSNVSMFITNIECVPAGMFAGPMVVSMRPVHHSQVVKAVQVTSRFPNTHGAPIHIGAPGAIGVEDPGKPHLGDAVTFEEGELPVFWACGVTPQAVAMESKPPLMITHAPGHMFVTDLRDEDIAVL